MLNTFNIKKFNIVLSIFIFVLTLLALFVYFRVSRIGGVMLIISSIYLVVFGVISNNKFKKDPAIAKKFWASNFITIGILMIVFAFGNIFLWLLGEESINREFAIAQIFSIPLGVYFIIYGRRMLKMCNKKEYFNTMENEQIKQKMPIGMILILVLFGLGAVSSLRDAFRIPLYQLGPITVSGAGATVIMLVIAGILGIIFYGILKRFRWARKLAIGWYIFSMALGLISTISLLANKTMYASYFQKFLPPDMASSMAYKLITASLIICLVFGWIIGLIVIIYLARKKDFFVN